MSEKQVIIDITNNYGNLTAGKQFSGLYTILVHKAELTLVHTQTNNYMIKSDLTLHDILTQLAALDMTRLPFLMKIDGRDHVVGTLDEEMQRMWRLRQEYREKAAEAVQHLCDLVAVHAGEHEAHTEIQLAYYREKGENATVEDAPKFDAKKCVAFRDLLEAKYDEYRSLLIGNKIIDDIVEGMIMLRYPILGKKGAWGVRTDFQVVWRTANDRGDNDSVLEPLLKDMRQLGSHHGTIFEIIFTSSTREKDSSEPVATPEPATSGSKS